MREKSSKLIEIIVKKICKLIIKGIRGVYKTYSSIKSNKKKKAMSLGILIFIVTLSIHMYFIVKISRLQLDIKKLRIEIADINDELDIKRKKLEEKGGFQNIEKRAKEELSMEAIDEIKYLEIE